MNQIFLFTNFEVFIIIEKKAININQIREPFTNLKVTAHSSNIVPKAYNMYDRIKNSCSIPFGQKLTEIITMLNQDLSLYILL